MSTSPTDRSRGAYQPIDSGATPLDHTAESYKTVAGHRKKAICLGGLLGVAIGLGVYFGLKREMKDWQVSLLTVGSGVACATVSYRLFGRPYKELLPKRPLTVEVLEPTVGRPLAEKTGAEWYPLAERHKHIPLFNDSCSACSWFQGWCKEKEEVTQYIIIRDLATGTIQALAAIRQEKNNIYLIELGSRPSNLKHPLNAANKSRVEGAGMAVMRTVAVRALAQGDTVTLRSLVTAIPFYKEKLHLTQTGDAASTGVILMTWSPEAMRAFVEGS